jgi:excisionase family DNA binding protein
MTQTLIAIDPAVLDRLVAKVEALEKTIRGATIKPAPEWMGIKEAAEHEGVSTDTIRRWINDGRLQAIGSGKGRKVRLVR